MPIHSTEPTHRVTETAPMNNTKSETPAHRAAAYLARMVVACDERATEYAREILDTPEYAAVSVDHLELRRESPTQVQPKSLDAIRSPQQDLPGCPECGADLPAQRMGKAPLEEHRHCRTCGKVLAADRFTFCDETCYRPSQPESDTSKAPPDERSRAAIVKIASIVGVPGAGGPERVVSAVEKLAADVARWERWSEDDPPVVRDERRSEGAQEVKVHNRPENDPLLGHRPEAAPNTGAPLPFCPQCGAKPGQPCWPTCPSRRSLADTPTAQLIEEMHESGTIDEVESERLMRELGCTCNAHPADKKTRSTDLHQPGCPMSDTDRLSTEQEKNGR